MLQLEVKIKLPVLLYYCNLTCVMSDGVSEHQNMCGMGLARFFPAFCEPCHLLFTPSALCGCPLHSHSCVSHFLQVTVLNHLSGSRKVSTEDDPMEVPVQLSRNWRPAAVEGLPAVFTGGWVGYAGYDTVRYVYGSEFP